MVSNDKLWTFGAAAILGDHIYLCGNSIVRTGLDPAKWFWRYAFDSGAWSHMPSMQVMRQEGMACKGWEGTLVLCGGTSQDGISSVSSVEEFYPLSEKWAHLPDLQQPRSHAAIASLGSELYACGGHDVGFEESMDDFHALASVEVLSRYRGEWRAGPTLKRARGYAIAFASAGALFVCAGQGFTDDRSALRDFDGLASIERLEMSVGRWDEIAVMSGPRRCPKMPVAVMGKLAGRVLIFGGRARGSESVQLLDTIEELDMLQICAAGKISSRSGAKEISIPGRCTMLACFGYSCLSILLVCFCGCLRHRKMIRIFEGGT